jgi:hypothetical protein
VTYDRRCRKTSLAYYYTRNSVIKSEVYLSESPPRRHRRIKRLVSLIVYGRLKDSLYGQYCSKGSAFWSDDWVICRNSHCNRSLQTLLVLWKDTQRRYHCIDAHLYLVASRFIRRQELPSGAMSFVLTAFMLGAVFSTLRILGAKHWWREFTPSSVVMMIGKS